MSILCSLILALIIVTGVVHGILYTWRYWTILRSPDCDRPEPLGLIRATQSFLFEYLSLLTVTLLKPFAGLMAARISPKSVRNGHGPVVMVHGWGDNRASAWFLGRRLHRDGWGPIHHVEYFSITGDVERGTKALRKEVDLLRQRDNRPITIIGHSMGGLVIRHFARTAKAEGIKRLLTLGTPHGGTKVAKLLGAATNSLSPDASMIQRLNSADRVPRQFDVIAIHSPFDAIVLPLRNSEYPFAFNISVAGVGHNAMLFSPKIYGLIRENLLAK